MTLASWGRSGDHQAVAAGGHKEDKDMAALLRFSIHHPHPQQQEAVGMQGTARVPSPTNIPSGHIGVEYQELTVEEFGNGVEAQSPAPATHIVSKLPASHAQKIPRCLDLFFRPSKICFAVVLCHRWSRKRLALLVLRPRDEGKELYQVADIHRFHPPKFPLRHIG